MTDCTPVLSVGQIVDAPLPPDQLQHGAVTRGVARGPAVRSEGAPVRPHPPARGVLGAEVSTNLREVSKCPEKATQSIKIDLIVDVLVKTRQSR